MSDFSDSESDDTSSGIDKLFDKATKHVQTIYGKLEQRDLLQLYALYKQSTCGPCNTTKPGLLQMQARIKWLEWNNLGNLSSNDAMQMYIDKVKHLDSEWFESILNDSNHNSASSVGWVVHSVHAAPEDHEMKAEHEKNIFDYVKDGLLEKLKNYMQPSDIEEFKKLDDHGMGVIHWATDRNFVDILKFLIESGADVNFRDSDEQTALHYASSCGHLDCIRVLLDNGANPLAKDSDGQTCVDVAENGEVHSILTSG